MTGREGRHRTGRAISTVLDAALFLLLVSAAIGMLYAIPDPQVQGEPDPDVAAEGAATLSTTLRTVEYVPGALEDTDHAQNRTDRGPVAELLAETTVANAQFRGRNLTRAPNHEAAVRGATRRTLLRFPEDVAVQVRSRWRPLPGSGLRATVSVGPAPPADVDVHAATVAVPVDIAVSAGGAQSDWPASTSQVSPGPEPIGEHRSVRPGRSESLQTVARRTGCSGLAHVLASRIVGTAFPPERTGLSTRVPGPQRAELDARYRTAATGLGLDREAIADHQSTRRRNEFLATALAPHLEAACEGYDSPEAAAERAAPGTVLVSVRTWSP